MEVGRPRPRVLTALVLIGDDLAVLVPARVSTPIHLLLDKLPVFAA